MSSGFTTNNDYIVFYNHKSMSMLNAHNMFVHTFKDSYIIIQVYDIHYVLRGKTTEQTF